jgi:hypothetical protein
LTTSSGGCPPGWSPAWTWTGGRCSGCGPIPSYKAHRVSPAGGETAPPGLVPQIPIIEDLHTAKGVAATRSSPRKFVTAKYAIPGRAHADFALLRGDPGDGLPGVPGVGEKTAAALVTRYGGLPAPRRARRSGLRPGSAWQAGDRPRLPGGRAARRAGRQGRPAARLRRPAARGPSRSQRLVDLSDRYNLDRPLNRVLAALADGGQPTDESAICRAGR